MNVLIAEDDAVSRLKLQRTLEKWGYHVIACENGEQALDELNKESPPQIVVLDWIMPGKTGIEICREVRQKGEEPYTYILLLTSKIGSDSLVEGMSAGADDFLVKPYDPNELRVRLRAGERIVTLTRKLMETRNALQIQATHDALTGIWNRFAILGQLDKELARSGRANSGICLSIMDIDHFKPINDTYGHISGDVVLREVASRLKAALRPYDSIGRYGGEEFLIILSEWESEDPAAQVNRLREAISGEPILAAGKEIRVTASFGVCTAEKASHIKAAELIKQADDALYRAKDGGRNRVECVILSE
jgi:diguanylate cyclase (GGDEF)-like protein